MKKEVKIGHKAQAAIEFLINYGWAILVVLVAVGALAYFGVLSPDKFFPRKCLIEAGIGCMDFKINEDSVTLVLRNGKGEDITVSEIKAGNCTGTDFGPLKNGEQATFKVGGCTNTANKKFIGDVNVTYTGESGFVHKKIGQLIDRVEDGCGICACLNTDVNCGNYPGCSNCNSLDEYSANYCTGNDVYRDYNDYGCLNQLCSPTTTPELVQSCTNGACSNGACGCQNIDTNCGTFPSCAACGANQACQNNVCVTTTCSDGTAINTCSSTKPLYCNSAGNLVNSCSQCGCPGGQLCQGDGSCGACGNIDTNCGSYPACNNCNSLDSYSANYCSSNNVYRDFIDYSCSSNACGSSSTPQLVEACAGNQACQSNQCVTTTCSDGTSVNTCSSTKPQYCNSGGTLVNSCSACGCPAGKACQGDGSCVNAVAQFGSSNYSNLVPPGSPGGQWFYDVTLRETGGIVGITVTQRQKCYSSSVFGNWCDSVKTDISNWFGTNYISPGNQIIWHNDWTQPNPGQTFTVTETYWGVDGNNNNVQASYSFTINT